MGIDTANVPLYLNIVFFGMLGLGLFFGFLRGLRKSIYSFIVKLVFYILFFATLGVVSRFLWNAEFAFIGTALSMASPDLSGAGSLSEALPIMVESLLGSRLDADLTNPDFVAFAEGVGMFVVKLIYALLYFTVIQVIYRFLTWIIYLIFFRPKKEDVEVHGKRRVPGMAVGLLSGALAVYATLVLLGGLMSISENLVTLVEGLESEQTADSRDDTFMVDEDPVLRLASRGESVPMQTDPALDPALTDLSAIVDAYNSNAVVRSFTVLKLTDDETGRETPLNLHLFDMIFSFEYEESNISVRSELAVFTDVARIFLQSDFSESNDLSDIEGAEIRGLFTELSNSELFTNVMPIALEMGSEHYGVDLEVSRDELYAIDYENELTQLGEVFATAFDMLNTAGALEDNADYDTVSLDGEQARTVFEGLGDSELATLGAYVAMEPLLEQVAGDSQTYVTVPEGIVWEDEFDAFGEVSEAILNTGITLGDIQSGDLMTYLQRLSSMDLTVILNSRIIEQSLVNVLSGEARIEGLDMMVVNDDIQWRDTVDDGQITEKGELRIVLEAMNTFADNEDVDAIEAFDQNVLLNISEDTLDAFLESTVLTDTIGDFIVNLETDQLVIPPSTLKTITVEGADRQIVDEDEIKRMFLAVQTVEITDFDTVDFTAELLSALEDEDTPGTLDDEDANTLLDSDILHATVSDVLIGLSEDADQTLIIPDTDVDDVSIRSTDPDDSSIGYISEDELKAVLETVIVLDLTDFGNIDTLDATTLADGIDTALTSAILHATISDQILQLDTDGTLNVPHYNEDDTVAIRETVNATEFINKDELVAMTESLNVISGTDSLVDFSGDITLSTIYDEDAGVDERQTILGSSTLQATISEQLLDLETDDFLDVPNRAFEPGTTTEYEVRTTSTAGPEDTDYVIADELSRFIQSLHILGIDDVTSFEGSLTISDVYDPANSIDRRDDILESGIMHATFSDELLALDDSVLIVPDTEDDGTTDLRLTTTDARDYVTRTEIGALIAAFTEMGYTDLESFDTEIASSDFFNARDVLLESSSIQATVTDKLLNDTNDVLLVPDEDSGGGQIRLLSDTYIEIDELKALLDGLDDMGLTDFSTLDFTPDDLFNSDYATTIQASATIQMSISDTVLENAYTTQGAAPSPTDLVVPDALRNLLPVDTADTEQIEEGELINLIAALDTVGVSAFDGAVDAASITGLGENDLDTILSSGSMHVTIDNMIDNNPDFSVPDHDDTNTAYDAVNDTDLHGISGVTYKDEIKDLVAAVNTVAGSGDDLTNVSFDLSTIQSLGADDQATIAASMTIRNTLTPDIESAYSPVVGTSVPDGYYHDGDTGIYLDETGFLDALDDIEAATP